MESEPERYIRLELPDGESIEATPDNTSLYTHAGEENARYDHVFIEAGTEDEPVGVYLFRDQEVFDALHRALMENGFPVHLNMRDVAECDRDAYDRIVARNQQDALAELSALEGDDVGIPAGWAEQYGS